MMAVTVVLPGYLQPLAEGHATVTLDGGCATVGDVLRALGERYPGVHDRIVTETGSVRQHVNIFVGDTNIRDLHGLASPLAERSEVLVLPAVSGG